MPSLVAGLQHLRIAACEEPLQIRGQVFAELVEDEVVNAGKNAPIILLGGIENTTVRRLQGEGYQFTEP